MKKLTNKEQQCGVEHNRTISDAPSFDDMQALFDEHDRRLSAILAHPGARPRTLNTSHAGSLRRRMVRQWVACALFCIAFAIGWGIALWHYNYDIYFLVFNLFLEAVYIGTAIHAILSCRSILRDDPAVGSRQSVKQWGLPPCRRSALDARQSAFSFSRAASVLIASTCTLVLISCSTVAGDGYAMTKFDRASRMECINSVDELISNIK